MRLLVLLYMLSSAALADDRVLFGDRSPTWMHAIGHLQVPGTRREAGRTIYKVEDCSATLLSSTKQKEADTILTAWHCIEFYSDLSKTIDFVLAPPGKRSIIRKAYPVATGGSMAADWALLRLDSPIPAEAVQGLQVETRPTDRTRDIMMIGYSRDSKLGKSGQHLTYDPACRITGSDRRSVTTDCFAHKGASGGPVIQTTAAGPTVYGVISQGNSEGVSIFIPTRNFSSALKMHVH